MNDGALLELLQPAIVVVPDIFERLADFLANLAQLQPIKIEHFERPSLPFRQFLECAEQLVTAQPRADFPCPGSA
jgi:hypothetical protein